MCPVPAEAESNEEGHSRRIDYGRVTKVVKRILAAKGVHEDHLDDAAQDSIAALLQETCPVGGHLLTEVYGCERGCTRCQGKSLFYCVVRRDGIDRIRAYSRNRQVELPEHAPENLIDENRVFEFIDAVEYPMYEKELLTAINERLSVDERRAVWMTFRDRKTIREVAGQLDVSVGKAWMLLQERAIPKLRAAFGVQN